MKRIADFREVLDHKRAFLQVRAANPYLRREIGIFRALAHDLGKCLNILIFGDRVATAIHRKMAGHHRFKNHSQIVEAICDWECARFTKPSKPLNARATWQKYYSHLPCGKILDDAGL